MADTVIKHPQAMLQLRLSNFSVAYQGIPAVVNLSLTLTAATVNLVTGVIGAGKTTLLKALSGMIGHTGSIELTEGARRFGADGAGALLQPLSRSLISPYMTVTQFLQIGLMQNTWQLPPDAGERVTDALARCSSSPSHTPRSPSSRPNSTASPRSRSSSYSSRASSFLTSLPAVFQPNRRHQY